MGKYNIILMYAVLFCFILGDSWLTASRYMLGVDGVVVCDDIPTFLIGLGMLFAAYYNFNISYPLEVAAVLEFIQR